uniref:Uncharacterized protein n=1 Tax=Zea mays TaxID=4577 RepID=C4IYP2_MAIZE|nr:unknown [Zea mays]
MVSIYGLVFPRITCWQRTFTSLPIGAGTWSSSTMCSLLLPLASSPVPCISSSWDTLLSMSQISSTSMAHRRGRGAARRGHGSRVRA